MMWLGPSRNLGDLVYSILQQQYRNCCVVPNGVVQFFGTLHQAKARTKLIVQ